MKRLAWFLAFTVGFLSLSLEILWIRLVTFLERGVPQSFALVLGLFLFGVAAGAALGKRACRDAQRAAAVAGSVLLTAGLLDLALPQLMMLTPNGPATFGLVCLLIFTTAALKAAVFPIAHHLGSDHATVAVGRSLSRVYFMNILGSTLGPLLTGFVLLDYVSLSAGFRLVGIACLMVGAASFGKRALFVLATAVGAACAAGALDLRDASLIRKLVGDGVQVKRVIETRQGIVFTTEGGAEGDGVYGGNAYDGRTNIDLKSNSNKIDRVYLLAALHPAPRRVLVIGLSSGAWTRVVEAIPGVERIDVVEINPGYLELIADYPHLRPLLRDERVKIHIDDGRRWLKHHPDDRYDLIVMNTTFHWRAHITNLLSREFMARLDRHLAPGGVMAFNATGSPDAFMTAAAVFPHAYQWSNFIYCARFDFRPKDAAAVRRRLLDLRLDGGALLLAGQDRDERALAMLLAKPFVELDTVRQTRARALELITDINMITEYKYADE